MKDNPAMPADHTHIDVNPPEEPVAAAVPEPVAVDDVPDDIRVDVTITIRAHHRVIPASDPKHGPGVWDAQDLADDEHISILHGMGLDRILADIDEPWTNMTVHVTATVDGEQATAGTGRPTRLRHVDRKRTTRVASVIVVDDPDGLFARLGTLGITQF